MPKHQNQLLGLLPPAHFALIAAALEPVELALKFHLDAPDEPVAFCYFLSEGAVASVVTKTVSGERVEVGLIGREGVTGFAAFLGNTPEPTNTFIQIPGRGLRIRQEKLLAAMNESPLLSKILYKFVHAFLVQATQTALMNGRANLDMRLARWILMASDRANSPTFPITHEFLALMLGVRRAGVTVALHELEGKGMIRSRRRQVTIADRDSLESFAAWSYGVPERFYKRAFGHFQNEGGHTDGKLIGDMPVRLRSQEAVPSS